VAVAGLSVRGLSLGMAQRLDTTMRDLIEGSSQPATLVRSRHWEPLREPLEARDAQLLPDRRGRWRVPGPDAAAIGELAAAHRTVLEELTPRHASLEGVYVPLTDTRVGG